MTSTLQILDLEERYIEEVERNAFIFEEASVKPLTGEQVREIAEDPSKAKLLEMEYKSVIEAIDNRITASKSKTTHPTEVKAMMMAKKKVMIEKLANDERVGQEVQEEARRVVYATTAISNYWKSAGMDKAIEEYSDTVYCANSPQKYKDEPCIYSEDPCCPAAKETLEFAFFEAFGVFPEADVRMMEVGL